MRGEERPHGQTQRRFAREQLEAVGGREQVQVASRRTLRRLHPREEPRLVGGECFVDRTRPVREWKKTAEGWRLDADIWNLNR